MNKRSSAISLSQYFLCLCQLLICFGCGLNTNNVQGVKPDSSLIESTNANCVESLQPTLRWGGDSNKKYDIAIWKTLSVQGQPRPYIIIYQKYGITGSSHTVEESLIPNSLFFWSIRETGTNEWTTLNSSNTLLYPLIFYSSHDVKGQFFIFKTPTK